MRSPPTRRSSCSTSRSPRSTLPLRQSLRDDLRRILAEWRTAAVLVTHDFTEAYRLGDRIVVYENGRVIQAAPRAELLWQPASERVAGIVGIRNVLRGTVLKASPDRIQFRWRGQLLEAVNSPTRSYLPAPESPLAFFIRPEYVRLIRKDRGTPDPGHHMNLMQGTRGRRGGLRHDVDALHQARRPGRAGAGSTTTSRSRCRASSTRSSTSRATATGSSPYTAAPSTSCRPPSPAGGAG